MKKLIVLFVALLVVAGVQAQEKGSQTKEQYVEQLKARAEKRDKEFDQAKAEANFDKADKNGDGVLTADETPKKSK